MQHTIKPNTDIGEIARKLCDYFETIPKVCSASVYGSILNKKTDFYSDIDLQIDVSGSDNGQFLKQAAGLLNKICPVIFYDYAPSLLPEEYVVSCAISEENPFRIVDLKCTATPHVRSLRREDLANDPFAHLLKLWVANTKHDLRGAECRADILSMYHKVMKQESSSAKEDQTERLSSKEMRNIVFQWLWMHRTKPYEAYLRSCEQFL